MQDVGHGTLLQFVGCWEIVILAIDAADEHEEGFGDMVFVTELLNAFLPETEGDVEAWEYGQQTVVLIDGISHLYL